MQVPDCPPEMEYIWDWFCQLSSERTRDQTGVPMALTSTGIKDWSSLEGVALSAFELRAIRGLDRTFQSPPEIAAEDDDDDY